MCCGVHRNNIKVVNFIWEQRTLFDEHIRFVKKNMINGSGMLNLGKTTAQHIPSQQVLMSCLNIDKNGILDYTREGKYICIAQLLIYRRNQTINRTDSVELEHIQDRPLCNQHNNGQCIIPGANTSIVITFYSKPTYSTLSYRKDDSELKLKDNITVSRKNISMEIYNVTVMVSGYEIIINITEFSDEDIGNYTVDIINKFGYSNCTVQLLSQSK
ncbi:unnamed protein product [Mytilus coruscus]|uniref:Uncharacterized protein n=1 Tax=Mytilus coruscus TaxID=42192 RepID=A0A6J8EAT7_MYTCO|nr:unnamed protein product [Mytilus coruscus]